MIPVKLMIYLLKLMISRMPMKALEDHIEGQRINAFDAVKVKTESVAQAGFSTA
jgi:hypothetical protein